MNFTNETYVKLQLPLPCWEMFWWKRGVSQDGMCVAKMLKEICVCVCMHEKKRQPAINGSESVGERQQSRSSHVDCGTRPGLFPSNLSMISRRWNRNSDRSHTSALRITHIRHWNLYISVAFCSNILQCQSFSHCCKAPISRARSVHTQTMWRYCATSGSRDNALPESLHNGLIKLKKRCI